MALLFQSNPDQWNLRKYLQPDAKAAWYVTRYQSLMAPGQLVLFWQSKGKGSASIKGLYGWGIITDQPREQMGNLRINLQYVERWISKSDQINNIPDEEHVAPIQGSQVLALESWKDHTLSVFPVGTNFLVTNEQMKELIEKIVNKKFPNSQLEKAYQIEAQGSPLNPKNFKAIRVYEQGGY